MKYNLQPYYLHFWYMRDNSSSSAAVIVLNSVQDMTLSQRQTLEAALVRLL